MSADRLEQSGLNHAWTAAAAALVFGPRIADPAIDGAHWVAWSRARDDSKDAALPPAEGSGETPHQALNNLAKRLRELRK